MGILEKVIAVLSITLIDLVLSGDNAAVIGLAIRKLAPSQRRQAALLGTGGAVFLRVVFTAMATLLLRLKYLSAAGGVVLVFITWKLVRDTGGKEEVVHASRHFWTAVGTIIVADLSMAFDNVMGVAGAAHGNIFLVIFGLLLSIPILIAGSTWLSYLMGRYPIVIYVGAGVLARTALHMIFFDRAVEPVFTQFITAPTLTAITVIAMLLVILWGFLRLTHAQRN